jgi:hypothetical protein
MSEKSVTRPRPMWALLPVVLAAIDGTAWSQTAPRPAGTGPPKTICRTNPTFADPVVITTARITNAYVTGQIDCILGDTLNDCAVCAEGSFYLWNPTLGIWHRITDPHCEAEWAECGDTETFVLDYETDYLPVGHYEFRADCYYGPCGSPGAFIKTVTKPFDIH